MVIMCRKDLFSREEVFCRAGSQKDLHRVCPPIALISPLATTKGLTSLTQRAGEPLNRQLWDAPADLSLKSC